MSKIANADDIDIQDNAGQVATGNTVDFKGGHNTVLGNTNDITVTGTNTKDGQIGAQNAFKVEGQLADNASVGNTSNVLVGNNSGSIGAGNRINIG